MSKPISGVGEITTPFGKVKVNVTYVIANNGIGSYEFWGSRGFDAGIDYPEFDIIDPIFTDETEEERLQIRKFINENFDDYVDELEKQFDVTNDG